MSRRVVVTGVGAITAQGPTADALWEGVVGGNVAIRNVEGLPMDTYRTSLGGEVQEKVAPEHEYRHPDDYREPVSDFALKASEEAVGDWADKVPAERWGVVIGSCNAGLLAGEEWYRRRLAGKEAPSELLLLVSPQAVAESLASAFGFKGPVLSVNTACAASANAIGYASELIRQGQADAVLAGGAESISEVLYSGFNALESLSPKPAAPYSVDREGLSLGEGGGMMVLMREDLARELGAPIKAELLAYSLSADGYHPTAPRPDGVGAGRAIRAALKTAGVTADDVDYVNSHGTGTAKNDPAETAATKYGLGEHAYDTAVSSTKSMIGHLLGAAGAVENIVTVRAIETQTAPPTANYTVADPDCDLDYVPNEARALNIDVAVSNNFAFGGANASIVWAKPGARPAPPTPDYDRVVITGVSAFTSVGTDLEALWSAYKTGRKDYDGEAGKADFGPSAYLKPKERKRIDRIGLFSIITGRLALEDSGLEIDDENRERVGVIVGTGVGPMQSLEEFSLPIIEEGPSLANPAVFPNTVYNAAGGQTAIKLGAVGVASTVTAQHAAGAQALTYAYDLASVDQADAVLAIASDSLTDTVIDGYRELGLLSGFGVTEAGITIVLERAGAARSRGARVYGELAGYGVASDAEGVGRWNHEGEGVERAMRSALEMAGVPADQVVAVWANAAGLAQADEPERAAIARVLGDVKVNTPKVTLGEPLGAGGSLNTALALLAWQHGEDVGPVVVNSSSLGGTHISLVLVPNKE